MPNSLFTALNGAQRQISDYGPGGALEAFQRFRSSFRGDARQEVQRLLNSGQMSQAQYNQLGQMASQLMGLK